MGVGAALWSEAVSIIIFFKIKLHVGPIQLKPPFLQNCKKCLPPLFRKKKKESFMWYIYIYIFFKFWSVYEKVPPYATILNFSQFQPFHISLYGAFKPFRIIRLHVNLTHVCRLSPKTCSKPDRDYTFSSVYFHSPSMSLSHTSGPLPKTEAHAD